jgi:hypothetical protein
LRSNLTVQISPFDANRFSSDREGNQARRLKLHPGDVGVGDRQNNPGFLAKLKTGRSFPHTAEPTKTAETFGLVTIAD